MKLIESAVWQALHAAGLHVLPVTADRVEVLLEVAAGDDGPERVSPETVRIRVVARHQPLSPSDLRRLADGTVGPTLVIVPTATSAAHAAAARLGLSLIATNPRSPAGPQGQIRLPSGQAVSIGTHLHDADPPRRVGRPGRTPWGALLVLRRLAEGAAGTQLQLAELTGITQPRVSQALRELREAGLVGPAPGQPRRSVATDLERALDRWLDTYPGPGGLSTYWYGLESPVNQAKSVIARLRERHGLDANGAESPVDSDPTGQHAVVSGDVAADQVAPWRRPQRAVVYTRRGVDLAAQGLTPAGEQDATLELTVPQDPGVWPAPADRHVPSWHGTPELPLADPLQILWDVRRAPGPDRDQAVEQLHAALRRLTARLDDRGTPAGATPAGGRR